MDETAMNKEYGEDRKWSPFEEFIEDMKSKSKPANINAILYISRCPPYTFYVYTVQGCWEGRAQGTHTSLPFFKGIRCPFIT